MQKIMFNDKFGLTQAVLEGRKTMTRRIIGSYYNEILDMSRYAKGEVVAIAQRYCDVLHCTDVPKGDEKGWGNKMFVKADLMPHHIEITDIKVERLQNISNDDCMKEGITEFVIGNYTYDRHSKLPFNKVLFGSPREAFAALIDKVSGKGTWNSNPWVFAYEFKLTD